MQLIIGQNSHALAAEIMWGRLVCCTALKTDALRQTIERRNFGAIIAGIRRDAEGSRAKERVVFSPPEPHDA